LFPIFLLINSWNLAKGEQKIRGENKLFFGQIS